MMRMFAAGALLASAGCATPSARISEALTGAGLDARRAQCVGDRLEGDLSIGQLQQLGAAARAYRTGDSTPGRFSLSDLLRVAARIDDPAVPIAVAKAAGACA